MSEPSKSEQRELLALQCQLARLKIDAARRKAKLRRVGESESMAGQLIDLAGSVPRQTLAKTALLPLKWRYRVLAGLALLMLESRQKRR